MKKKQTNLYKQKGALKKLQDAHDLQMGQVYMLGQYDTNFGKVEESRPTQLSIWRIQSYQSFQWHQQW